MYSCIVIIHKPSTTKGYYGADVSGPVFKRIAQKIFTDVPSTNQIKKLNQKIKKQEDLYEAYNDKINKAKAEIVPNMIGMSGMDAVALLGNMGAKVQVIGAGKVKKQSVAPGHALQKGQTIILELL
jgi:cell division protein FtsI (penicillin-binding protein 3)